MIIPNIRPGDIRSYTAIISLQADIRHAMTSEDDSAAMALDALLDQQPGLRGICVMLAYQVFRPFNHE